MSGEAGNAFDWYWGHMLWQRKGISLEDWAAKPYRIKLAYIASEQLEIERPVLSANKLAKAYLKSGTSKTSSGRRR